VLQEDEEIRKTRQSTHLKMRTSVIGSIDTKVAQKSKCPKAGMQYNAGAELLFHQQILAYIHIHCTLDEPSIKLIKRSSTPQRITFYIYLVQHIC
jgi:hypothetical protein